MKYGPLNPPKWFDMHYFFSLLELIRSGYGQMFADNLHTEFNHLFFMPSQKALYAVAKE